MTSQTAAAARTDTELRALLAQLDLPTKVALVVGADMWSTTPVPAIGLGPVVMSDGPAGVRGDGTAPGETSASFAAPSAVAATWDRDLAGRLGELFAAEAARHDVHLVLAPQINLQRTPVGGRHFECYSEDPLLTGEIALAVVGAAQAAGTGMCVKHYVANDSETERTSYVAVVDERTLREVYLAPFEALVQGGAWSVMAAYSGVDDGTERAPMTEHHHLVEGVLKEEWGFDGLVVSDWVATGSVAPAVRGGLDLQMPGPDGPWGDGLLAAVQSGEVAESELDDKVLRLLRLADRVGALGEPGTPPTPATSGTPRPRPAAPGTAALLREVAARAMVVLRDDAALLPLDVPAGGRVALLGPGAVDPFTQGGGSGFVPPDRVEAPADALRAALPGVQVDVRAGARSRLNPPLLDAARLTDPVTGTPGLRAELLDAAGQVRAALHLDAWSGWFGADDARALGVDLTPGDAALRLVADVAVPEAGTHEVGVGTVGRHAVHVDGRLVQSGERVATEDVILASEHNHPIATLAQVAGGDGARARLDATLQVIHPVGYATFVRGELLHGLPGPSDAEELAGAVDLARGADVAVVIVQTTEEVESEGFDRRSLALPGNQTELVAAVAAANPRTVVVVDAGAPVLLPFLDSDGDGDRDADAAPTVLWGWLAGQEGAAALADVLTGVTEPSGRLPWTLPAREEDVPVPHATPSGGELVYAEGVDVGYRGWQRAQAAGGAAPAAPFGHGLGWTTWAYDDVQVAAVGPGGVQLVVTVTNTGPRAGREVVQAYVEPPVGGEAGRPVRWLGGFAVVEADGGATVRVPLTVPRRAFETWDVAGHRWTLPAGTYRLRVGRSVGDLRLDVAVHPDVPTERPGG